MLLVLDENNVLRPTIKIMQVKAFRKVYDSYQGDHELAIAAFSVMHYMYMFDSLFLWEYQDEDKRLKEVKRFVHRGSEVKVNREVRTAMNLVKYLYEKNAIDMYVVMRRNIMKLKDYASRMSLVVSPPISVEDALVMEVDELPIKVDSKEFTTVNSMLLKQQTELEKFEAHLVEAAKNSIDVYGGGKLGAYE